MQNSDIFYDLVGNEYFTDQHDTASYSKQEVRTLKELQEIMPDWDHITEIYSEQ